MKEKQEIESEKMLERSLKSLVESELNGWSLKLLSQFISGLPDRICLIPLGIIFFAEIKTTKQKPHKIQLWVHAKLRGLGFDVYVIDRTEHIQELREKYGKEE